MRLNKKNKFGFILFCLRLSLPLQPLYGKGEVLEWLKRHAWEACNRQNRFAGSNPVLSAGDKDKRYPLGYLLYGRIASNP